MILVAFKTRLDSTQLSLDPFMDPFQRTGLNVNKKDMINTVVIEIMI
jgi:hypothetical protein